MKDFIRKVSFGVGPEEKVPTDPLNWAKNQLDKVPVFKWQGKKIYTEKELREYQNKFSNKARKKIREKYKDDPDTLKKEQKKLGLKSGRGHWINLELSIRHTEAVQGNSPVFTKLWYFWANHFTISSIKQLQQFSTGAYQRESIRTNMDQTFEKMVFDATVAWPMIRHLDNSQNIGPDSPVGLKRTSKGKEATINENHARELLELHTVSPNSGYDQEDVIQMSYLMSGWKSKKDKEGKFSDVYFEQNIHQPGRKRILGLGYSEGQKALSKVIRDLARNQSCKEFIAMKLCRYLITDYPTKEMIAPIIEAWKKSDGFLPEIHKAAIEVAFNYSPMYKKFQNPENWLLQMVKMTGADIIPSTKIIDDHVLGDKIKKSQIVSHNLLKNIGHHPYFSKQPNGWSDISDDWMSPELLIRRLVYSKEIYNKIKKNYRSNDFYTEMILKNFDNPNQILKTLNKKKDPIDRHVLLFNLPEVLKS